MKERDMSDAIQTLNEAPKEGNPANVAKSTKKLNVKVWILAAIFFITAIATAYDINGKFDKINGKVDLLDSNLIVLNGKVAKCETDISGMAGRLDASDKKVGQVSKRQDSRVQAENQQYKQMLAYVKGAEPENALAKKSDAEVEKLLNNGVWDIEGQIQSEYNRLVAGTATEAKKLAVNGVETAKAIDAKVEAVAKTASRALDAGETAVSAISTVANQKTKLLGVGHSVSKASKKSIAEQIADYRSKYAVIKSGAPEE